MACHTSFEKCYKSTRRKTYDNSWPTWVCNCYGYSLDRFSEHSSRLNYCIGMVNDSIDRQNFL